MKRVLVLINLAAKRSPEELAATARSVLSAMQTNLDQMETIFTSTVAFGFVGVTSKDFSELHKTLNKGTNLRSGDNISVMELGILVISTHPGLHSWNGATQMISVLAESSRQR
jgi:hypothetical protein